MKKLKTTEGTLYLSIGVLFLSIILLFGTTYAWFYSSVTSLSSSITAGSLSITAEYSTFSGSTPTSNTEFGWTTITDSTNIFADSTNTNDVWYPGKEVVRYLRIKNEYDKTITVSIYPYLADNAETAVKEALKYLEFSAATDDNLKSIDASNSAANSNGMLSTIEPENFQKNIYNLSQLLFSTDPNSEETNWSEFKYDDDVKNEFKINVEPNTTVYVAVGVKVPETMPTRVDKLEFDFNIEAKQILIDSETTTVATTPTPTEP